VLREWSRLKAYVTRTPSLCKLKYAELYTRLFDHSSEKSNPLHYHNVLLLVAIVMCMAIDTSICERGFSLMNLLKTAKRSTMGNELLRILMAVCSLGKDAGWDDPTKIPVEDIIEIWREQSSKGRCANSLFWRVEALLDAMAA
jgi:hypothetical protein